VKGHYAEVFKQRFDVYDQTRRCDQSDGAGFGLHSRKILMITGKPENRIIRAYKNARFYKSDERQMRFDPSSQKTNLTKLIGRPILWNFENQMTGDIMHLVGNKETEKLDSLKVLNNAFLVSKDTLGTGYNQVKGLNLYGKFRDNKLYEADIIKNTEVVYYMRNDDHELIGINKNVSSKINPHARRQYN
jgi:hypothetical protein